MVPPICSQFLFILRGYNRYNELVFVAAIPPKSEFSRIYQFFQELLRNESRCRLSDEYPLIFDDERVRIISIDPKSENYLSGRLLARFDESRQAHLFLFEEQGIIKAGLASLVREIEIDTDRFARFCFVGSVITAPAFRQQGLQRELFHVLLNACFDSKIDFVALWSNQIDFYQKLGFSLGGLQATWLNNLSIKLTDQQIRVNSDWCRKDLFRENFFRSYDKKRLKVKRSPEEMELLFGIPQMKIFYTQDAYLLVGKGEDFPGVCHEWAGPANEVLACIQEARLVYPELRILSPGVVHDQDEAQVLEELEKNAFESRLEYLALFRCLNPNYKIEDLQPENLRFPFFIWGLDSV